MIKILKLTDSNVIEKICADFGLQEKNGMFYAVFDGDDILEFVRYHISGDTLCIDFISDITHDFSLVDGLLKTLLFACDVKTVKKVFLNEKYERAAKALRFERQQGGYVLQLENYGNNCEKD